MYSAVRRLLQITGPRLVPGKAPVFTGNTPGMISIGWQRPDGRRLWLFWGAQPGQVQVNGLKQAVLHDVLSGAHKEIGSGDAVNVPVSTSLSVLEW